MGEEVVSDLSEFLQTRGGFHDSRATNIVMPLELATLELTLDDINANYLGLPEYPGKESAAILFKGVQTFECSLDTKQRYLWIYEIEAKENEAGGDSKYDITIKIVPEGHLRLTCSSVSLCPR